MSAHSEDEDDLDYVPPPDDNGSDSSGEQDAVEPSTKAAPSETDPVGQKKRRDALWASFQASVSTPSDEPSPSKIKRVKIEKTYLFAGKHVREVVEVLDDSEEAKKWPRWSPSRSTSDPGHVSTSFSETGEEKHKGEGPAPLVAEPGSATTTTTTPMPGSKRPGPRKPRTSLPSIPKVSPAKKITTLDKSAMDWRAHVASQSDDVKDDLEANRRGGGYLEKVDFLKRVQDRREDAFEASKVSKRRKM